MSFAVLHPPIIYHSRFVEGEPLIAYGRLRTELQWEERVSARKEYYCSDIAATYTYGQGKGRREYKPQPWHDDIRAIQQKLEAFTDTRFEMCVLNMYDDEHHSLGWHADDSPEIDNDRSIAIVSLGAEREIWFRPNTAPQCVNKLKLENGSLCLMGARMQLGWQHRIPRASFQCAGRISLTFRGYKEPEEK